MFYCYKILLFKSWSVGYAHLLNFIPKVIFLEL